MANDWWHNYLQVKVAKAVMLAGTTEVSQLWDQSCCGCWLSVLGIEYELSGDKGR